MLNNLSKFRKLFGLSRFLAALGMTVTLASSAHAAPPPASQPSSDPRIRELEDKQQQIIKELADERARQKNEDELFRYAVERPDDNLKFDGMAAKKALLWVSDAAKD